MKHLKLIVELDYDESQHSPEGLREGLEISVTCGEMPFIENVTVDIYDDHPTND